MSGHRISTCLWFDNNGQEAAEFYVALVPNSRVISHMGPEDLPLLTLFELDGVPFQALNGGAHFTLSEAVSIVWMTEDQAETDRLWSALTADGGAPSRCGWLKDRFGLSWQIVPREAIAMLNDADADAAGRAQAALMAMDKIDIAAMRAAVSGG